MSIANLNNHLARGKTCLGLAILLPNTARENWARKAAASLSAQFKWALERQSYDANLLSLAIERLRDNLSNPIHFGDNKPGWTNGDIGGPTAVPDARFNYFDLFSFGISGEDGYTGFLRDCGLPPDMPYTHVVAATALLLIDDAIRAIDSKNPWYATWALYQAQDLLNELQSREEGREGERKARTELASKGGAARHQKTNLYKPAILSEWNTGKFNGNKAACARWAVKQFPIEDETVKRWLRKSESTTQQAE